jgi:hypothetical protein
MLTRPGHGSEAEIGLAFADAYRMLNNRITLFMNLPMAKLDSCRCSRARRYRAARANRADRRVSAPPTFSTPAAGRRGARHGAPAGDRHRLRNHGRAAGRGNVAIALLGNTLATARGWWC